MRDMLEQIYADPKTGQWFAHQSGCNYVRADLHATLAAEVVRLRKDNESLLEVASIEADRAEKAEAEVGRLRTLVMAQSRAIHSPCAEASADVKACATEGCENTADIHFERGGVGSDYCGPCYLKVQAIPFSLAAPQEAIAEIVARNPEDFEPYPAPQEAEATTEVQGWQVKDYADGWIDFATAEEALAEVRAMGGALIRPIPTAQERRPAMTLREIIATAIREGGRATSYNKAAYVIGALQYVILLAAEVQAIRDKALEEAAEVAMKRAEHYHNGNYALLAADIRAMRGDNP